MTSTPEFGHTDRRPGVSRDGGRHARVLALTDAVGRIIFRNRTYLEFAGGSMEDHLLQSWHAGLHPADRERIDPMTIAAFSARAVIEFEGRFRAADGSYCWLHTRANPYQDADGAFAGYVGISTDITARRSAAAERDRALVLLDTIDDASPLGIAFVDSGLRLRRANRAFRKLLHLEGRPLLGLTPAEVGGTDWGEPAEAILRGIIDRGEPVRDVIRGRRRDAPGTFRNWLANLFPVPGETGTAGIGIVLQEMTDLKAAEEAHRISAERYRTLTNTLPQIVLVRPRRAARSRSSTTAGANTAVESDSEALGDGWTNSLHPDDVAPTLDRWRQSLATGEPYERIPHPPGRWALPLAHGAGAAGAR